MAETDPNQPAIADPETGGRGRVRGLIHKIKIVALLLVVVLVECAAAAFFLPTPSQTEAMATAMLAEGADPSVLPDETEGLEPETEELEKVEVSLGEFGVTSYQPLTNTTLRIDFQLYATVLTEEEGKFSQLLDENQHRFREQVLVILRSAELTDLTDAGLGLIKRKILEKTNRLLGEALVQEVIFSDFSFIEQ